jgi:hypothetical protein
MKKEQPSLGTLRIMKKETPSLGTLRIMKKLNPNYGTLRIMKKETPNLGTLRIMKKNGDISVDEVTLKADECRQQKRAVSSTRWHYQSQV